MVLIETDIVLALASITDKHHEEVKELLRRLGSIKLSPYTLIELDLLVASERIKVKIPDFYEALEMVLSFYDVSIAKPSPKHLQIAWALRREYGLTFFDSLHAAVAIHDNEVIVSYDKRYSVVRGVKYKHPQEILRQS